MSKTSETTTAAIATKIAGCSRRVFIVTWREW
jgi:hypothetical protein